MSTKAAALITIHQIVKDRINQLYLRNFSTIKEDIKQFELGVPKSDTDFSDVMQVTQPVQPIFTPLNPKRKNCK